jgi:SAM-dependent methyltransferase
MKPFIYRTPHMTVQSIREHPSEFNIGRSYCDPIHDCPHFTLAPAPPLPWSAWPTRFTVKNEKGSITRTVAHPHLCLLELVKRYTFKSILDIGCGDGNEADLFKHLGYDVVTINADDAPSYKADYKGDYLDIDFPASFDAIWCSHTLEHVTDTGAFLRKVFRDLKVGGVFAVSVPYNEFNSGPDAFTMGHYTRYNLSILFYHLICAGFDLSNGNVGFCVYGKQISAIVRKVPNNITRRGSFALFGPEVVKAFPIAIEAWGGNHFAPHHHWFYYPEYV